MNRTLARLLCFALTPVIVLGVAGRAAAQTVYSEPASGSVSFTKTGPMNDLSCQISGYWKVSSFVGPMPPAYFADGVPSIVIEGSCKEGPFWVNDEATIQAGAPGCGFRSDVEYGLDGSFEMELNLVDPTSYNRASCIVSDATFKAVKGCEDGDCGDETLFALDDCASGGLAVFYCTSFAFALGLPPLLDTTPATGGCTYGSVAKPTLEGSPRVLASNFTTGSPPVARAWNWVQDVDLQITATGANRWFSYVVVDESGPGPLTPLGSWTNNVDIGGTAQTGTFPAGSTKTGSYAVMWWDHGPALGVDGLGDFPLGVLTQNAGGTYTAPSPYGDIVGFGYVYAPTGSGITTRVIATSATGAGRIGLSDPATCSFYWGAKMVDFAGATSDEPLGPVAPVGITEPPELDVPEPDEPDQEEEDCPAFDLGDPSTWIDAGMCASVSLLGSILNALQDLAAALIGLPFAIALELAELLGDLFGGLLDGIEALFMPSVESWDFESVKAQFDARPPGSIINSMAGGITAMGSSFANAGNNCGVLFDVLPNNPDGQNDLTACEVRSKGGLNVLYTLAQFLIVSLTGLSAFHIIKGTVKK